MTAPQQGVCVGDAYLYNAQRQAAARGSTPLDWSLGKTVGGELIGAPEGTCLFLFPFLASAQYGKVYDQLTVKSEILKGERKRNNFV